MPASFSADTIADTIPVSPESLTPRLIDGESNLGLLTVKYVPSGFHTSDEVITSSDFRLRTWMYVT